MENLQDIITNKVTTQAINQLKFEQIQQRVVNKIKNADLKPLDKLFNVCLDQIAIPLMANPNQDAYETFSLFKKEYFNYQGAGHISDGSRSLIDYGGDLQGEYYQLQKKAKTPDSVGFERTVWDNLAPRIVDYFNQQHLGAEIVAAWFSNNGGYRMQNISDQELARLEEQYKLGIGGYGFFIVKGMLKPDQIHQIKEQSLSKAKQAIKQIN